MEKPNSRGVLSESIEKQGDWFPINRFKQACRQTNQKRCIEHIQQEACHRADRLTHRKDQQNSKDTNDWIVKPLNLFRSFHHFILCHPVPHQEARKVQEATEQIMHNNTGFVVWHKAQHHFKHIWHNQHQSQIHHWPEPKHAILAQQRHYQHTENIEKHIPCKPV